MVILVACKASAQNESPQLPFSNPIVLNPAFAGIDQYTQVVTGNQYYHIDSTTSFNILYFSYNTFSEELNGGLGLFFQQGIIGARNISTSEIGFAYSSLPRKTKDGDIRFGIGLNFLLASKQWFAGTLDRILTDQNSSSGSYLLLKPRFSLLGNTRTFRWGITAGIPLQLEFASNSDNEDVFPLNTTLYLARIKEGYKHGLTSQPFIFVPELMVFYQQDYLISRVNARLKHSDNSLGAFLQSDFTNNIHTLGATFGLAGNNIRLELNAGAGIPGISDEIGFCGELSLQLTVPHTDYTQINPWAPRKR